MMQLKSVSQSEMLTARQKILAWFFAYPTNEFTLNELSSAVKVAKTTARSLVLQLTKDKFLNLEKIGILWRIKANQEHHYFTTKKIPYNLNMVYESGIAEAILEKVRAAKAIILFGSYRKGDDTDKSDMDIAVEAIGNKEMEITELGIIKQFGYRKNVKVNMHIFSRSKADLNVFTNIANGIVLYGLLEAKP